MTTPRQPELPFTEDEIERSQNALERLFAEAGVDPEAEPAESFRGKFSSGAAAWRYLLAGNAYITLRSLASGNRFTYRVAQKEQEEGARGDPITFVSVLTGPDNWANYKYLGYFFATTCNYKHGGANAKIAADAPSAKAFAWAWENLKRGVIPEQLEVYHQGRCGRCGRKLTVPESIESGFGPECVRLV